ncbi:hypothetical protein NQ314_002656 [Rhamnusium bicolor]|uniref:Uncharacterized protein n=1 Tax=Rhamnusium bicolor TaxID=1586634 RepID=A0AAV8ZQC0_9CUCU|nr:hypothetical protein NQ314_002656 [Rhamnusium bicolor]
MVLLRHKIPTSAAETCKDSSGVGTGSSTINSSSFTGIYQSLNFLTSFLAKNRKISKEPPSIYIKLTNLNCKDHYFKKF